MGFSKSKKSGSKYQFGNRIPQFETIIKTIYDGNIARYDWNQAPHDHLKCKECGELIDIELIDDDVRRKVKNKYQFEVDDVKMVIIGTCHKHKNKGK